jgi:hypothetical protein
MTIGAEPDLRRERRRWILSLAASGEPARRGRVRRPRAPRWLVAALTLVAVTGVPRAAAADEGQAVPDAATPAPPLDATSGSPQRPPTPAGTLPAPLGVGFEVWLGIGGGDLARSLEGRSDGDSACLAMGAMLSLRYRSLRLGGLIDGAALLGTTSGHLGVAFGPVWEDAPVRFELLGEVGAHSIGNVGADLFAKSSGNNSGWLPYVGARASLAGRYGAWFAYRQDLRQAEVEPTLCMAHLFAPGCDSRTSRYQIGGWEIAGGILVSFGH